VSTSQEALDAIQARLEALMRLLIDSGDATPQASRMVLRVLREELLRVDADPPEGGGAIRGRLGMPPWGD
jgi:hypothetical protein